MKDKIFVSVIIAAITLTVIISLIVGVSVYNKNKVYVLDASSDDYMEEENALKAKSIYDTKEMKEEFLTISQKLSNTVYSKLLDGTVTDESTLKSFVNRYNRILVTEDWESIGVDYPSEWIGTWYLDNNGFVKFKFAAKIIEPTWVQDEDVKDYIVAN